ncbi:DUF2141 domain-containing protein [Novipirellula sp. SH528]|uniref:DUF2141 domain-containing protein n=1 Tax=Novipirellula sp. SH528 TaxID=3454466 RepID=UPI003FA06A90
MQNQDEVNFTETVTDRKPESLWAQNHGNVFLMFLAGLVVLGSMILLYRQSRFVAPRFPAETLRGEAAANEEEARLAGNTEIAGSVALGIDGADGDEGALMIAIYGSKETFANQADPQWSERTPLQNGTAVVTLALEGLPEEFAIVAFHDQNDNGQFDADSTERIGFSGTLKHDELAKKDAFKKALIKRPVEGEIITISLQ